jgi:alginate O-acetyltransferase complex protein AlgI
MSYTIDVYRRRIKASSSLIEFLAYVSFFPHMIAGPIQRSTHFLPQFRTERNSISSSPPTDCGKSFGV